MNRSLHSVPDGDGEAELSIGDLAERTGVSAATLRVWEARYGFPVPQRRASGHRRYTERDVALVIEILARREAGVRLDVAVEQVATTAIAQPRQAGAGGSVFARLRRTHPALVPHRLSKRTLLALSWAIEDEFCAQAQEAHLFGAFQQVRHFQAARFRWAELARVSASAYAFADFPATGETQPVQVTLAASSPMLREWSVVCDSAELPVALAAWELPGQHRAPDRSRLFEAVWTVDPTAVREAARTCVNVAVEAGAAGASEVQAQLASNTDMVTPDPTAVTALFNRVISYVDFPPPR